MIISAALCALTFFGQRAPLPKPATTTPKVDRLPALEFPAGAPPVPAPNFLNWSGFGYLKGDRAVMGQFPVTSDWSALQAAYKAPEESAAAWHTKFVIFTRGEASGILNSGLNWFARGQLLPNDVDRIKADIVRFGALVAMASHGKAKIVPEVTVEEEPLRLDYFGDETQSLNEISAYLRPRMNGGTYVAEDSVFRGPYQSAFVIHPTPSLNVKAVTRPISGTPTTNLPLTQNAGYEVPGNLANWLFKLWAQHVTLKAEESGLRGQTSTTILGEDWANVALGADVPTETLLQRLKAKADTPVVLPAAPTPRLGFITPETDYRIETDPERGPVLVYLEKSSARSGGLSFPMQSDGKPVDLGDKDSLSFDVKSSSKDPLCLYIKSASVAEPVAIQLGESYFGVVDHKNVVSFHADGAWNRIVVNLKSLGVSSIESIWLAPPANASTDERRGLGPITYWFSNFELVKDVPATAFVNGRSSTELLARKVLDLPPSAEKLAYFKDPSDIVKLNAIWAYSMPDRYDAKDPATEEALISAATSNYNTYVAEMAIRALGATRSEKAIETLRKIVRIGLSDPIKGAAAEELAKSKEAKWGPEFITFLDNRSREAKLAGIRALGMIPGKEAGVIRMTLLFQVDPQIKLAVTETADPGDEAQMRKMLWSVVNEPSDAVRALSAIKLIQSPVKEFREEGYKAIKDDSVGVRLEVLDWLAKNPSEAHRQAFRLAVVDRSPRVRAAAIMGFASLEKGATLEEIANTLKDLHPDVQLALIHLAKTRHVTIPIETQELMKSSPDPRVLRALTSQ